MSYLLMLLLLIITYQDFKSRAISWWTIPALLGIVVGIRFFAGFRMLWWQESLFNVSFLLLQFLFITIYFSIKRRALTNIIDTYLGLGDILFVLPLALLFPPSTFMLFYILSILVVLVGFLCCNLLFYKKVETIPLAGGQALFLIILLIFSKVFDFNLFNTSLLSL